MFLTRDDLMVVWRGGNDPLYCQAFDDKGDGGGIEVYGQVAEQLSRVSRAIDRTFESLYAQAWSDPASDCARGGAKARTILTIERTANLHRLVRLVEGTTVEELATDYGEQGGVEVATGRRYTMLASITMLPGDPGPAAVEVEAEREGLGYNNPLPGSICGFVQPGARYINNGANIVSSGKDSVLVTRSRAATVIPEHVGRYVRLVVPDAGTFWRRIVSYAAPRLGPVRDGGRVTLDKEIILRTDTYEAMNHFTIGELVIDQQSLAVGKVVKVGDDYLVVERISGVFCFPTDVVGQSSASYCTVLSVDSDNQLMAFWTGSDSVEFVTGETLTHSITGTTARFCFSIGKWIYCTLVNGQWPAMGEAAGGTSGATAAINMVGCDPMLPPTANVTWTVLDFQEDLGLLATNAESPIGGRSAMLDELGEERSVRRLDGETDDQYRVRMFEANDVVSPNAIRRAINRVLMPYGIDYWLYEVGTSDFPGFFFDAQDQWDISAGRARDSRRYWLSVLESRAFFLVGIMPIYYGEYGFDYDGQTAYDVIYPPVGPLQFSLPRDYYSNFYDGQPYGAARILKRVWTEVDTRRAAGVGFDLVRDFNLILR